MSHLFVFYFCFFLTCFYREYDSNVNRSSVRGSVRRDDASWIGETPDGQSLCMAIFALVHSYFKRINVLKKYDLDFILVKR